MILRFILFFFSLVTFINASTISIDENSSKVSILEQSQMFIDTSSKLDLKKVKLKVFQDSNTDYIRLGYTADALWLKFKVKNLSDKKLKRYLTLTSPILDTIELYTKTATGYSKQTQGVLHLDKYDRNNILHPSFEINFKPNETKEFYYKTHSLSCANYFKLFLKDNKTLYDDEFLYQLVLSLFFGAMIALIFYNLSIYIFTKDQSYLYYVLYMFFVTWNHSSYTIMLDYLLGEKYTHIDAFMAVYYLGFIVIFSLLFIKTFLEIKQYKIHNIIINSLIIICIFLMAYSTFQSYIIEYFTHILLLSLLYVFYLCLYSLYKKNPQAKYIIVGWIFNIIGIIMLAFISFGYPNLINIYPYFYEATVFIEAILFSIALASKLNKNKELEKSVKTNEVLTRELHHRVKNNMQFIILMYRLKLANLTTDEISQKLKETEGSIQAMSKTHEILYNQEDLETVDTKDYFENLIDELKRSFDTSKIKIKLNIEATLDIQSSIYCGIILNELITNSFKYAFQDRGIISISLTTQNSKNCFIIEDDGVGFDYKTKQNESFGLSFVEAMVKDELKGLFGINSQKGTKVTILF